jgi:hypothetical protein
LPRQQTLTATIDWSYELLTEEEQDDVRNKWHIIVEGVSLVRNYRSQFAPLMRKKGYAGLREQMLKKIEENKIEQKKIEADKKKG